MPVGPTFFPQYRSSRVFLRNVKSSVAPWIAHTNVAWIRGSRRFVLENPLFRKNPTGTARSREQPLGQWPMVSPRLNGSTSQKKQSTNHMAISVWSITGATRGTGAEIVKAALVDGKVVTSDRTRGRDRRTGHIPLTQIQEFKKCRSANLETATWKFRLSGS